MRVSRWLLGAIAIYLGLGLLYDWATPIFEAPDEGYHFAAIRWIAKGNGLPVQRVGEAAEWAQEGSQPPLYNLLAAGLTFGIDDSDWPRVFVRNPFLRHIPGIPHNVNSYRHTAEERFPYRGTALAVHLVRWFSLGLGALILISTYQLALAVFPAREPLARLAVLLVAFNPKFIFLTAAVNNDNLLMLLSTATLLAIVRLMQPEVKDWAWKAASLGLLLGLAALAKVSGLVLWPVAALGVGWGAWRARDWRRFVFGGLIVAGLALLVSGWWFWRNHQLYGEWLGLQTMVAIAGPREPVVTLWELIRDEWRGFFLSYWSVFGVFTILPAEWVHFFFDALTLWALAGLGWAGIRRRPWRRAELALLALFCLLTLIGVARWTMQTFASQGRLMFGAIAPLAIFMAAGLIAPFKSRWTERWNLVFGGILALIAAVIPVVYIAPRYDPPSTMSEADLPDDLRPVHAMFDGSIELIGYTADDQPRLPGESQKVTLYWRAVKPMAVDHKLALHLLGRDTAEVGKIDTWPGGGNAPTSQWKPGAIFADTYFIPIDRKAMVPSLLRLNLAFWDDDPENTLLVLNPKGEQLRSVLLTVGRAASEKSPEFTSPVTEGATFEYGISLLGLAASTDGALYLELYWRTEQPIGADYTVFLHLVDAQGIQVVPPADAPPLNGDWPTSAWIPGQAFADVRLIPLPPNLHTGRYTLQLGLYDPVSGARVAAFRADGAQWPQDMVVIPDVIEIK